MSEQTKIAWCDSTINFWEGCTKVSAGCAHCYAEARDKRFTGGKLWGKGAPRRKSKSAVKDALAYNRMPWICNACGGASPSGVPQFCQSSGCRGTFHRRRIFSLSLGDWLDDEVPIEWLAEMLDTIRKCDQVTWILCTKRPENFHRRLMQAMEWLVYDDKRQISGDTYTFAAWLQSWHSGAKAPANIILLTSVENQEQADIRIPQLLAIPAACRGLSLEPLLGPVDLTRAAFGATCLSPTFMGNPHGHDAKINWLIIGGESGSNARPCNVDWIRSLVQQGKAAGVATFVKQLGADPVGSCDLGRFHLTHIKDKKGSDPAEWPADLRVRQFPT